MITYGQSVVLGLLQGVTEMFPVSSLGHSVVLPALLGWHSVVNAQSASESFYLAFLVGLHVATAIALVVLFRKEWARLVAAFVSTVRKRAIETPDERLAWLLVVATIPAGLTGLAFEHVFRVLFAKPLAAGFFLFVNGLILFAGERVRLRSHARAAATTTGSKGVPGAEQARRLATLDYREAGVIGTAQVLALLAGISRSGITMVAGLVRGLDHEDAARFSFLLATPIILAAGLYKLPDLLGPLGSGVRGQIVVGSLCAGVAAFVSVSFLLRYFVTRTLTPFAIYCCVAGAALMLYFV